MKRAARDQIRSVLPNTVDLLVIGVEAGWSLDQSVAYITQHTDDQLSREFKTAYAEIASGIPRHEALRGVADRCQVTELTTVITTILTSETTGASVAPLLRVQSDELRRRSRQRAEEQIRKAPLKMTGCMAVFIFPSIFCALLAPAVVTVIHSLPHGL